MKMTLKLARVGMNMQEATISAWLKHPGEHFDEGDPLYAIETEKVVQDVLANASGTLLEILVPAGENAAVGDLLCVVELS